MLSLGAILVLIDEHAGVGPFQNIPDVALMNAAAGGLVDAQPVIRRAWLRNATA
jgi:hypothetical protein